MKQNIELKLSRYQVSAIYFSLKEYVEGFDEVQRRPIKARLSFINSIIELLQKELQEGNSSEANTNRHSPIPDISTNNNHDNSCISSPHAG